MSILIEFFDKKMRQTDKTTVWAKEERKKSKNNNGNDVHLNIMASDGHLPN